MGKHQSCGVCSPGASSGKSPDLGAGAKDHCLTEKQHHLHARARQPTGHSSRISTCYFPSQEMLKLLTKAAVK